MRATAGITSKRIVIIALVRNIFAIYYLLLVQPRLARVPGTQRSLGPLPRAIRLCFVIDPFHALNQGWTIFFQKTSGPHSKFQVFGDRRQGELLGGKFVR